MKVASTTSPSRTFRPSLRTVSWPSLPTWTIERVSSDGRTTDFSLLRKSSWPIVATDVLDSLLHAPIEWGWAFA